MLATVRLDPKTEKALVRLASATGRSRSEIIREAILELASRAPAPANNASLYDTVADLVGSVHGGDPTLSQRTGEKLRALLVARAGRSISRHANRRK